MAGVKFSQSRLEENITKMLSEICLPQGVENAWHTTVTEES